MSILSRAVQALTKSAQAAEAVQRAVDPLVAPALFADTGKGNQYISYEAAVTEIVRKFNNEAAFGCQITKHILEWRASTIAGNGLNAYCENEQANEIVQDFIKYNYLDSYGLYENVLEGEQEGKALFELVVEEDGICLKHYSWVQHKYIVNTKADDYEYIESIEFPSIPKVITGDDLKNWFYVKLGGSRRYVNLTPPRIANVLYHIDSLDSALADIRKNNRYFGGITPFMEAQDETQAKILRRSIFGSTKEFIWKIGRLLIAPAKFTFVEPSGNAVQALTKEIETLAKIISAATGIPVHFLGYVDLMSNRSTAVELMELVNATTNHEREIWKGKMTEICERVLELAGIDEEVSVNIPVITLAQVELISNVYGNLYNLGAISLRTLRSMIPGIDPEEEAELIANEKGKEPEPPNVKTIMEEGE